MYGEDIKYKVVLFSDGYENLIRNFNCGNKSINEFLDKANKVYNDGLGVTKLIINETNTKLIGFYSLCSSAMLQTIDKNNRALPAIELKMFALDIDYQHISYYKEVENEVFTFSDAILSDIIYEITELSTETIGVKYIILQSVFDAIGFYKRNRFIFINDIDKYLELPYDRFSSEGCKEMCLIL